MSKKEVENETVEAMSVEAIADGTDVGCSIEIEGDQVFLVDNGNKSEPLELTNDKICFVLPKNSANRKWFAVKKVEAAKAEGTTSIALLYKGSKKIGAGTKHIPNEKLIAYLPEDLQAEYKAIIDEAIALRDAAKAKPMTDLEKAQAKLAKAQKDYEAMLAAVNGQN